MAQGESGTGTRRKRIHTIRIQGFRSLADAEIQQLRDVTVLLGANGAGKSNIFRFFEMLRWMLKRHRLGHFIELNGGADDQLFRGSHTTKCIKAEAVVQAVAEPDHLYRYAFELVHAHPDRLVFVYEETVRSNLDANVHATWSNSSGGYSESELYYAAKSGRIDEHTECARAVTELLGSCRVFQYHDTEQFKIRRDAEDNIRFLGHGENLAPILLQLEQRHPRRYERLCRHIARVLPGFDRFEIEKANRTAILRWRAVGTDKSFGAHLTSDGSLRFFALATLLNLPPEMLPDLILLDEPELGLHPAAISLVAGLIKSLSSHKQIIVATQSPLLVDAFGLDEIIVLELRDGRTEVRTFDKDEYRHWLDDYSTGELWQKNLIGGRP